MAKRREDSANESLAEALSRVMVSREEADHRENFDWATTEGRGDRMPRFLERAIEDVPHAARHSRTTYQGRSRRPFARTTLILSVVGVAAGVAVSLASPSSLAPILEKMRQASTSMSFATNANAATPRLGFGEVLRNYSDQAAYQAARANIVVSDLVPGTTLSAGTPVSDTSWSLPQSDLDNVVITFPTGVPAAAMRATVEIPGNTAASSGKFRLEMRQAQEPVEGEPTAAAAPVVTDESAPVAEEAPAKTGAAAEDKAVLDDKAVVKARSEPTKAVKRAKVRPQASLKRQAPVVAAAAAVKSVKPSAATSTGNAPAASAGSSLGDLLSSWKSPGWNATSPNALTMFSLGGPIPE
jgi:hypothetical protein